MKQQTWSNAELGSKNWFVVSPPGGSVKHPIQNSTEPEQKPSLAAQFAEFNALTVAALRCQLVTTGLWYFRHQPGIIHLYWCVSFARQLCTPNFCFAHRRRNMEIFKTLKITKDTSCSASVFETLCTPEWQILTPTRSSLIIVCHEPLELDTFALLPACASKSKLYPTVWTSFPLRSLLHCRFYACNSAGLRIQTKWRLFWRQKSRSAIADITSNSKPSSAEPHALVSWLSVAVEKYLEIQTDASVIKTLLFEVFKENEKCIDGMSNVCKRLEFK